MDDMDVQQSSESESDNDSDLDSSDEMNMKRYENYESEEDGQIAEEYDEYDFVNIRDEVDQGEFEEEEDESSGEEQYWTDNENSEEDGSQKVEYWTDNEEEKCEEHEDRKANFSTETKTEKMKCEDDIPEAPVGAMDWTEEMLVNLTAAAAMRFEFRTMDHAQKFYEKYGWATGFGTRNCNIRRSPHGDSIIGRSMCCNKEGWRRPFMSSEGRKKTPQKITRCGCKARCCISLDSVSGTFKFTVWEPDHNHPLALNTDVPYFRSFRSMMKSDVDLALGLRNSRISISQIYEFMVTLRGGYRYIGFLEKDMYNRLEAEIRLRCIRGDANTLMDYMHEKKHQDPGYDSFFSLDEEGRLANIIWRDSRSMTDYLRFSDTLVFDSTYKTNMYGKPLVLFLGANHHRGTVLFGCALLADERTETYVWALQTFKRMMNGISPKAVLTDGDEAMHNAVVQVFPEATHRLCTWHVGRNIGEKIKDPDILKIFLTLMYWPMSIDSFERKWADMVRRIGEAGARPSVMSWLELMYSKKERWAGAFFTGKFFAMMTSTQRCEGMNRHLKKGLSKVSRISDVPVRVAAALYKMREKVQKADNDSRYSKHVPPDFMADVAKQLANHFTDHIYKIALYQMEDTVRFNIIDWEHNQGAETMFWVISQAYADRRGWDVQFMNGRFACTCGLYETDGIPCAHIFTAMKHSGIKELPQQMIHPRWCKATVAAEAVVEGANKGIGCATDQYLRSASLTVLANSITSVASVCVDGYVLAMRKLNKLNDAIQALRFNDAEDGEEKLEKECGLDCDKHAVKDPNLVQSRKARKAKAAEDKVRGEKAGGKRHCRNCGEVGHNSKSCKNETKVGGDGKGSNKRKNNKGKKGPTNQKKAATDV